MSRRNFAFAVGIFLIGCGWASLAFFMVSFMGTIYVLGFFTTIAVVVEPLLGLTFAVASLPWSGLTVLVPELLTLTKAMTLLTCLSLGLRVAVGGLQFPPISNSLRWYVFSFLFSFCTSLFTPAYNEFFFEFVQTPLLITLFPFLFVIILRNYYQIRVLSVGGIMAASGMAIAILVLGIQFFIRSQTASEMRLSAGADENELGQILTICFGLCLLVAAETTFKWRAIAAAAGLLIVYAILLTQSRGTWTGILFATSITTLFVPGLSFKQRVTVMMGIVLIGVAAIYLVVLNVGGVEKFFEARIFETFHGGVHSSARRIDEVWPLWLDTIWRHPIIGIGLGGGHSILSWDAHNDVLMLLGERGILGFSLYIVFQILIIVETLRNSVVSYRLISVWILLFLLGSGMFTHSIALKGYAIGIGLVEALNNIALFETFPEKKVVE